MSINARRGSTARAASASERARPPIPHKVVMLGSALALTLGALTAPAQAATASADAATTATSLSSSTAQTKASWHFWKSYWTWPECVAVGQRVLDSNPARYRDYWCHQGTGTDKQLKWHLYIRY
ncbi:hypothetical protein BS35_000917 [Actinomadura glauciflava]|nr:hypothetical protein [Actinomadura glauciflava]